ncbi:hypothetical protein GUJ93_ZPchr0002g26565 [Zizania palustris]|uniref:Uncharacterized protein n=1 Tax=Zizania palustris TaxID=103762 RepID=A0A8J5RX06_ZIZPA|nr:hypothetical protein GUJ93_ZPchr0002g26565 [Zizania palustris]
MHISRTDKDGEQKTKDIIVKCHNYDDCDYQGVLRWDCVDIELHGSELPPVGAGAAHLTLRAHPVLVGGRTGPTRVRGEGGGWGMRRPDADAGNVEPALAGIADNSAPKFLGRPQDAHGSSGFPQPASPGYSAGGGGQTVPQRTRKRSP